MLNNMSFAAARTHKTGSRSRTGLALGCVLLLLAAMTMRTIEAADGDLDLTFGAGGKVMASIFFSAMVLQSDGKIVAAGGTGGVNGGAFDFALARYDTNGNLDPTFGSGGIVTTHFPNAENITAIAVQSNGKIVAIGIQWLARYNSNGSLDATFGSGGTAPLSIGSAAVTVQSNGKIVVAGWTGTTPDDIDFALLRYNADGSLDQTFGSGGKVITAFSISLDLAFDAVIQTDGKIIAVGYANDITAFALARYNTDGSLDQTFGSGGKVVTSFNGFTNFGQTAALQKDGKILVGGSVAVQTTGFDFALARYNMDGSLDQTFGLGGKVSTDFNQCDDIANDIAVQDDGKIILVGRAGNGGVCNNLRHIALARYNTDGTADPMFGVAGKVITNFSDDGDIANGVAIQSDGKIVIAGIITLATGFAGVVARYNNLIFDACAQDDSNGNLLKFNSVTGSYLFTNCSGFTLGGKGTVSRRGSTIMLQHATTDRRVTMTYDGAIKKASASVQIFPSGKMFSIADRNTANDTCACP